MDHGYTYRNPRLQVPKFPQLDQRQRACLAAAAQAELSHKPSIHWLARAYQVNRPYIALALKLSPEQRQEILNGHDKTSFVTLAKAGVSDVALIAFVRNVGVERMLNAAVVAEAAE
jgi:hypothetical protein